MRGYKNILTFRHTYFFLTLFLFAIEVFIALFVNDSVIRPYVGDFLVVMLLYCALRGFLRFPIFQIALFVLLFSFAIEFLQYLHFLRWARLANNKVARVVLGDSFAWADIVAYTTGVIVVLFIEKFFAKRPLIKKGNF